MRALRLRTWKSEPELVDVDEPEPGRGEVVIRVGGAGACHSDLHLMHEFEGGVLPWGPPFTLGHENAGWVHALGEGVTGLRNGQAVARIGQRPVHDRGERIGEVALLERVAQGHFLHVGRLGWNQLLAHARSIQRGAAADNPPAGYAGPSTDTGAPTFAPG